MLYLLLLLKPSFDCICRFFCSSLRNFIILTDCIYNWTNFTKKNEIISKLTILKAQSIPLNMGYLVALLQILYTEPFKHVALHLHDCYLFFYCYLFIVFVPFKCKRITLDFLNRTICLFLIQKSVWDYKDAFWKWNGQCRNYNGQY